jgi:hypothetical protein
MWFFKAKKRPEDAPRVLDEKAAELLTLLDENDPIVTSIFIPLKFFADNEDMLLLTKALHANDYVTSIHLDFDGLEDNPADWDSFLCLIETRWNLKEVHLHGNIPLRARFLPAIQRNTALHSVKFYFLQLPGDWFAAFLDAATSVTELEMDLMDVRRHTDDRPGGTLAIANALQRNTQIRRLKLVSLDEMYLIPIVSSLISNTTLKELALRFTCRITPDSLLAITSLLDSTRTLQRVGLLGSFKADTLGPIAQGLIHCESITEVKFEDCHFVGQDEVLILNSIVDLTSTWR